MIHNGRGSALRQPRLNWSAGVELFLEVVCMYKNPLKLMFYEYSSNVVNGCSRICSEASVKQVTSVSGGG